MAMNRNMTVAEKEIRDFAQKLMERAEQREGITFTEEQKEQVLDYAAMIGDDYNIRQMVRNLASAVRTSDEEKINEILWDARDEIDSFPDRSVGMAELKGYGYTADDMFPLRQEAALEQHRVGEKVYCLQPDGTHGEYASQEMILGHEGLFGIEKEAWQRIMEQDDERDYEEMGFYKEPMTDLDKEEALKMYDAGEKVYLKPSREVMQNYIDISQPGVIIKPLISGSPVTIESGIPMPTLEKIIVDTLCDEDFSYLQGGEWEYIVENSFSLFTINSSRLFRYAGRRGKLQEIKDAVILYLL